MRLLNTCKNCGQKIVLITKEDDYMGREVEVKEPFWVHPTYFWSRRCDLVAEPVHAS